MTESAASHLGTRDGILAWVSALVRSEYALFLVGAGAIAVHLLDDSFVQPEPGTSAGDHLASGLVPIAVLVLAAAAYSRLRAGLRAAIALALGAFGLATGVEGIYYTLEVGPSGDDYTGLLATPAGLLLLAVGAGTLWRTRRVEGSRSRRYLRRSLLVIAGGLVVFYVVQPVVGAYFYTHVGRAVVPAAKLGTPYEEVTFTTSDGLKLAGWYVASKNGAAVIALPGRSGPQEHARMLARHGYGVLLFDPRGNGDSEGDPNRWAGNTDLEAALAFLAGRTDVEPDRIGGIGLSAGGEMLLQTAGESQALKAVVSEGAGVRSVREQLELSGLKKWTQLPLWAVTTAAWAVFSNHGPPPNQKHLVSRIAPGPLFLIYATHGAGGEELNRTLYDAAGAPKQIWEISDAGHTGGLDAHPREYEQRVIAFFDRALLQAK